VAQIDQHMTGEFVWVETLINHHLMRGDNFFVQFLGPMGGLDGQASLIKTLVLSVATHNA
jgi:hypothetical protein